MTQAERSELISEIMDMLRQLGLITDQSAAAQPDEILS